MAPERPPPGASPGEDDQTPEVLGNPNAQQQVALDVFQQYVRQLRDWMQDPVRFAQSEPLKTLVLGGPGTGKVSYFDRPYIHYLE